MPVRFRPRAPFSKIKPLQNPPEPACLPGMAGFLLSHAVSLANTAWQHAPGHRSNGKSNAKPSRRSLKPCASSGTGWRRVRLVDSATIPERIPVMFLRGQVGRQARDKSEPGAMAVTPRRTRQRRCDSSLKCIEQCAVTRLSDIKKAAKRRPLAQATEAALGRPDGPDPAVLPVVFVRKIGWPAHRLRLRLLVGCGMHSCSPW